MKLLEHMALSIRHWFTSPGTRRDKLRTIESKDLGAEAQFLKGLEFENGEGGLQDYTQAAHWYAQAAGQNHCLAQLSLAMLYRKGQGVPKDEVKSQLWLTRAAQLGSAAAQYRLGVCLHVGPQDGLPGAVAENRIEALKWVHLSAAQGYPSAENACEFVALGMTREEVAESTLRVGAFVPG